MINYKKQFEKETGEDVICHPRTYIAWLESTLARVTGERDELTKLLKSGGDYYEIEKVLLDSITDDDKKKNIPYNFNLDKQQLSGGLSLITLIKHFSYWLDKKYNNDYISAISRIEEGK
jgi:hypothetical protein